MRERPRLPGRGRRGVALSGVTTPGPSSVATVDRAAVASAMTARATTVEPMVAVAAMVATRLPRRMTSTDTSRGASSAGRKKSTRIERGSIPAGTASSIAVAMTPATAPPWTPPNGPAARGLGTKLALPTRVKIPFTSTTRSDYAGRPKNRRALTWMGSSSAKSSFGPNEPERRMVWSAGMSRS
jgi:hypothetical protein